MPQRHSLPTNPGHTTMITLPTTPNTSPRRIRRCGYTLLALLISGLAPGVQAAGQDSTPAARQRLNLTLYQNGPALITEQRHITLSAGDNTLRWHGLAPQLQADSVLLRDTTDTASVRTLEQSFQPARLNAENLLKQHLGREVIVIDTPPGQAERRETARLLALDPSPVLQFADRIETQPTGRLAFPGRVDALSAEPLLELRVHSKTAGQHSLALSYLSGGLHWQADYVAELASDKQHMQLNAWASLRNDSGQGFEQARLQLLAGEPAQSAPQPRAAKAMLAMAAPATMADDGISAQSFADYHLYTLPQPIDLPDQTSKQVLLFQADQLPIRLHYRLSATSPRQRLAQGSEPQPLRIDTLLSFSNRTPQLGQALAAGNLRIYQRDNAGQVQLIGTTLLPATARNGDLNLRLGNAFDLSGYRRQLDFKYLESSKPNQRVMETRQAIELHNAKSTAVTIQVEEHLPGDWQILESTLPYQKLNANLVSWQVSVPAGGKQSLEYRLRSTLNN